LISNEDEFTVSTPSTRYFEFYHSYDDDGGCAIAELDSDGPAWDLIDLAMSAKHVSQMPRPMPVRVISKGALADIRFGTLGIPLFSTRAVDVISVIAGKDIQILPAKMGSDEVSRKALNILADVDCLDVAKSKVGGLRPDGTPKSILRPALRVAGITGRHLFRVKTYRQLIIASCELKKAIERSKLTGATFEEVLYADR
jgi:hypothetical protein